MPSMLEIYQKHAAEYDELVDAEDFEGNLSRYLVQLVDWKGQAAIEAGVGTGRVTAIYVDRVRSVLCFDRSPHMMEAAARRLRKFSAKVSFQEADNLSLPTVEPKRGVFIEGWSWGHSIVSEPAEVETVVEFLLKGARRNLQEGGPMVLIETMGTNTEAPMAPNVRLQEFYELLVQKYGFHQEVMRTDYRFETVEEAERIVGFFFGQPMKEQLKREPRKIVPEWTGVWSGRN